jgi:hypothetical protein
MQENKWFFIDKALANGWENLWHLYGPYDTKSKALEAAAKMFPHSSKMFPVDIDVFQVESTRRYHTAAEMISDSCVQEKKETSV